MKETRDTISSKLVRMENVTTSQNQQSKSQVGLLLPHICIAIYKVCCKNILHVKDQTFRQYFFRKKTTKQLILKLSKLQGYKHHHFKIGQNFKVAVYIPQFQNGKQRLLLHLSNQYMQSNHEGPLSSVPPPFVVEDL